MQNFSTSMLLDYNAGTIYNSPGNGKLAWVGWDIEAASPEHSSEAASPRISFYPIILRYKRGMVMKNNNDGTTEKLVIDGGYGQLSGEELKELMSGKTVWGEYLYGRNYISYSDKNGKIEGVNDIGSHHCGEWDVNIKEKTLTVSWDGWDNWTGRAYYVNGEIQVYDIGNLLWRTTFKKINDGKSELRL